MVGYDGRVTGMKRGRERRVADFNMDAPASGCTSDLSRRSYDPLSTDNAAASYRDRSRGSPIPLLRHVRPSRPSLSLPFVQVERRRVLSSRYTDSYNSPRRFFHVAFALPQTSTLSSSYRDLARKSLSHSCDLHRSEIETGSEFTYEDAVYVA